MYLNSEVFEEGNPTLTPDDSLGVGHPNGFDVPVYQTVPEFMAKIKNPDDVLRFAEKFSAAIAVYRATGGDQLRHMPFVTQHKAVALEFIFKDGNNGNTFQIVDETTCRCAQCEEEKASPV